MFTHKINLASVPIGFGDRKLYDPDAEPFVAEPKFTIGNDLVFYDQNQDGKLELSELQQVYGAAFAQKDFNELRRIIRFGDAASYLDFKNHPTQKRDDKIVPMIRQQIEDDKQAIQDQLAVNRKILDEFEIWRKAIQDTQYSEIKHNETQQSGFLDKLEKKYKQDVQVVGHPGDQQQYC